MTMVPSKSRKQQNKKSDCVFYNNTTTSLMNQVVEDTILYNNNNYYLGSEFMLSHMAEEEDNSSTPHNITIPHHNDTEPEPQPEAVSTSKEEEEIRSNINNNNNSNNNNWLQLSIGFHQSESETTTYTKNDHHHVPRSGLELELLTTNWASSRPNLEVERGCSSNFPFEQTTSSSTSNISTISMSMPSGPISTTFGQQQVVPSSSLHQWAFGPLIPHSMPIMSSSSSLSSCSSLRPSLGIGIGIGGGGGGTYNYPPSILPHHHHHSPFHFPSSSSSSGFDPFRVVDPPRRPHSGIWFMLQASPNQGKEPFLPQIPKNYLRIKDGRMTVRLLLKYLVSKLKLDNESEIEITCRGQQLLPFLTLQHVRDNIWTPRDTTTRSALLSDSSTTTTTTDHVMVLHYGRRSNV